MRVVAFSGFEHGTESRRSLVLAASIALHSTAASVAAVCAATLLRVCSMARARFVGGSGNCQALTSFLMAFGFGGLGGGGAGKGDVNVLGAVRAISFEHRRYCSIYRRLLGAALIRYVRGLAKLRRHMARQRLHALNHLLNVGLWRELPSAHFSQHVNQAVRAPINHC